MTWEDGYCDYPKPREHLDNISDDNYFDEVNEIYSSSCETNEFDGGGRGNPIGLAVADMSCRQYALGEGYYLVLYPYHYRTVYYYPLLSNGISCIYLYKICLQKYEIKYPCNFLLITSS